MFKILRRLADRRRFADSQYGWLFQPYLGNQMVALVCRRTDPDEGQGPAGPALDVGLVALRDERVQRHESLVLHLPGASLRRSAEDDQAALDRLLNFIANRPLVIWSSQPEVEWLNRWLRPRIGFDLPNAVVGVASLYERRRGYGHHPLHHRVQAVDAARWLGVEHADVNTLVDEAMLTAELYLHLRQRQELPASQG